jgi:two-component system chemotaxis sensor kinase CheA
VPVERLFNMLERTALDAALSLGKEVSVTMTGGAHRIDGDVLELLRTGLLHVVRNSVVHGIESPAERGAMGKARIGHIHLAVAELESDVLLSCDDDGGGVNLTAARARLGLRPDTEEREVLQALLVGGASTAGQLSELSGRGVGLDVMRDVSERLGGQLELANRASGGLSVRLRFPARLRLLQGIELQSGDLRVLVPLDQISGALQLDTDERLLQAQRGELGHDGVTLATASLGQALGLSDLAGSERVGMIVAGSDGPVVLLAQRLGEVRQGLLRPLPPHAQASALVAGLVLDPFGLPQLVLNCKHVTTKGLAPARTTARRQAARVLVVDDSLTTRMLEQSILEANGYRVDLASSAEEGLARAAQERFDLFLVDVEMPGMDGFDFIARTQADETLRGVPAVLVSSRSGAADFARGAAVGARGYVVKHQFDQHEFLSLIQRLTRAA